MDQGELTTVQEMELTARKMSDSLEGVAAQYLLVQIFVGMSAILLVCRWRVRQICGFFSASSSHYSYLFCRLC